MKTLQLQYSNEIIIAILAGTLLLFLFATFILAYIIIYRKKRNTYKEELTNMQVRFQQELLQSQLEMQEQTFNTISREIHDNVGQILSLAKVQLNIIDQSETLDKILLTDAKDSVSKAMTDLRDIAKSLNAERIELYSLPEITAQELQRINRAGLLLTSIQTAGEEQPMQQQKKLIIFRIIQEAMQNILKHSKATNALVMFCYEPDYLRVEITDNGIGFNPASLTKKDGLGLQNIINRAALIGGKAEIKSNLNEGTTINITSPYA